MKADAILHIQRQLEEALGLRPRPGESPEAFRERRQAERLSELLGRDNPNPIADFTRIKMREEGFMRKLLPPMPVAGGK